MNSQSLHDLARAANRIASHGASRYLHQHQLQANPAALEACIKSHIALKLPEALDDAKAALDCNMSQVAVQTFAASLTQAGIEAAKESGFPLPVVSQNLNHSIP